MTERTGRRKRRYVGDMSLGEVMMLSNTIKGRVWLAAQLKSLEKNAAIVRGVLASTEHALGEQVDRKEE